MSLPRISSALRSLTEVAQRPRPFIYTQTRYRQIPHPGTRHTFSLASELPASDVHAVPIRVPTVKDLEEVDLDPDTLIKGEDASIGITSRAAEVRNHCIHALVFHVTYHLTHSLFFIMAPVNCYCPWMMTSSNFATFQ